MSDEWTPLDDIGVQEAWTRAAPERFSRAVCRATASMQRLAIALDWDRFLDTEADIAKIRALPEAADAATIGPRWDV